MKNELQVKTKKKKGKRNPTGYQGSELMSALKSKYLGAFSETTVAEECGEAVNSDKTMKNPVF